MFCAFAVFFLLFRQTGTGKQGRWRQRVQEWFEKPFTRYLVAPVQFEPHFQIGPDCHVGSTILRLHKTTRIRKLRQLLLMQPVHAELTLHWQVSRKQFSLVVLPVTHVDTQRQIRTLEMTLIQRWNPSLNFPFILKKRISKAGPDNSFAVKQLAASYQAPGTRLHRKLRKILHKLGALSLYSSSKQEPESSWMILAVLSERSLALFNLQHIYAVHRLSNNLDEPPKSMVQGLLQKILVFKGGVKPPKSRPLQIPLLSHQGFRGTIKTWLRQAVISRKDLLVPFHLPPCKKLLLMGNHHKTMEEFDWDTPPMCICRSFQERHPEAQMVKHPNDESSHSMWLPGSVP